ncbi:MAG: hypothetical protein ACI4KF_08765 [Huintestinicola sp.]
MDRFRKIMLGISIAAWLVCCLFLNGLGAAGFIMSDYDKCGIALIISTVLLLAAVILSFSKKTLQTVISAILNAVGTAFFIYPISVMNAIPNTLIPKESTEKLAGRIYPAVIVTIAVAAVLITSFLDPVNAEKRAARRKAKYDAVHRKLKDDEKII